LKSYETLKRVLDRSVSDLIAHLRELIAKGEFTGGGPAFSAAVVCLQSRGGSRARKEIWEFLYENVYFSAVRQPDSSRRVVIAELFEFYMKMPRMLPISY
jgi:hypothetical protein